MPRSAFRNSRHLMSCSNRSLSFSLSTLPPSSAHRGTGTPKWWANTVCVTSCGSTLSSSWSTLPKIFMSCCTTPPRGEKVNVVAPPVRVGFTSTTSGHRSFQRGISSPSHSIAFSLRYASAALANVSAICRVGATTSKFSDDAFSAAKQMEVNRTDVTTARASRRRVIPLTSEGESNCRMTPRIRGASRGYTANRVPGGKMAQAGAVGRVESAELQGK